MCQEEYGEKNDQRIAYIPDFSPPIRPNLFSYLEGKIETHLDSFKAMYPRELLELICSESNRYAQQKGEDLNVCVDEIICFIGILLLSGYNKLPSRRLYWANSEDIKNSLVEDSMRRNRFEKIMQFLHLDDNTKINEDRYFKVRGMFDILNKTYKQIEISECLSIDESIVPYYGKHGTKQFIRGKPIRFGFTLWCCTTSDGMLLHAEPYCGTSTLLSKTNLEQGADVVLGLIEKCSVPAGCRLYFDNLFTSLPLLDILPSKNIGGTGTLRENRTEKAPLISRKLLTKEKRDTVDYASDGNNLIVNWNDNRAVIVATNCHKGTPKFPASRYDRKERRRVPVDVPGPIFYYNRCMGGVDLLDQTNANYRIRIRSRKWWWPLFAWGLNASMVNSWRIFRRLQNSNISLLEYIRTVTVTMLKTYGKKTAVGRLPVQVLNKHVQL